MDKLIVAIDYITRTKTDEKLSKFEKIKYNAL